MLEKEIQETLPEQNLEYSTPDKLEMFEKQSSYFNILRDEHEYFGGNNLKEMLDFCQRNNIKSIISDLKNLKSPF
ncbi:hypothetical protein LPB90_18130 [Chryseobacterium sp. LC2016-29]|uniref:hypothetical protein n=1 Tax=Chryseobacterium sp. LC2016-29 TaxID=2897331 RepID=UPI001E524705|nr:hypothetical protein [Chryseobacterium sp. LC2016-29]MCD0480360.1 hypothetical protein [Chryseobacterium sp. LC2016-29]